MIISIDPHIIKPYAIAIWEDEILIDIRKESDVIAIEEIIQNDVSICFIEDQYLRLNANVLLKMAHSAGIIAGICAINMVDYEYILPNVWQTGLNLPRRDKSISKRNWQKLHSQHLVAKAQEYTDIRIEDDDCACAVLLGRYAIEKYKKE